MPQPRGFSTGEGEGGRGCGKVDISARAAAPEYLIAERVATPRGILGPLPKPVGVADPPLHNGAMTRTMTLPLAALTACLICACDSEGEGRPELDAAMVGFDTGAPEDAPIQSPLDGASAPDGPNVSVCQPKVKRHPVLASPHILATEYQPSAYNSNPPSSGPHCSVWGSYATFAARPLPRCNYIHNLEHGAVVLLHNCALGCPQVTAGLAKAVQEFDGDEDCDRPRLIISPDESLDHAVAAAAWGATFTADCLDELAQAALSRFVREHYNRAPEDVCSGGGVVP